MTNRRKRTDGSAGIQQITCDAQLLPMNSPVKLTAKERKIWQDFFVSKARRAWTNADLYTLANLCRATAEVELLTEKRRKLDDEDLYSFEKLSKLIDVAVKRVRLLSIYLQLHPEATQGKAKDQQQQNQRHQQAQQAPLDEDDLLGRVTH